MTTIVDSYENTIKHPYKVTYIHFTTDFNLEHKKKVFNDIQNIQNTANKTNKPVNELVNEIDNKYTEIFLPEKGFELHHYIFIGMVNNDIRTILGNIEKTLEYIDKPVINSYFKYDCEEIWGIFKDKYTKIKFIYSSIRNDDTISSIKINIFNSIYSTNSSNIFIPDNICLTGRLIQNYDSLISNFTYDNKPDPHSIIVQNMVRRLFKKYITNESLSHELISIGVKEDDVLELLEQFNDISNPICFQNILENKQIYLYIEYYLRNKVLTHNYYTFHKTPIFINSLLFLFLDPSFYGYNVDLKILKNTLDTHNMNMTIESIGSLINNEIIMYDFRNIHAYVEKKAVFNMGDISTKSTFFNGFITKFFPKITENTYQGFLKIDVLSAEFQEKVDIYSNILEAKNKLYYLLDDHSNILTKYNTSTITNSYKLQNYILHNINLPNSLDLRVLFNEIPLSFDLPFVKFKDPNTKEVVYKIYKPISTKYNNNYIPHVKKSTLLNWIKISNYEYLEGSLIPIKSAPKFIQYKLKLIDIKDDSTTYKGDIYKINSKNGIRSFDIEDITSNKIIPNVQGEFIVKYTESLKVGDEVEFYKYSPVYADIEVSRIGQISFKVYWKDLNKVDDSILPLLIQKLNQFIDNLYKLEHLKKYNNIILKSNPYLHLLNDSFYNTRFLYNINFSDIRLPKNISLGYDNMTKIAKIFFPFVSIISDIFYKGDSVEFFSKIGWINAKIEKLHDNGEYDVSYIQKGSSSRTIDENVDYKLIRSKGDVKYRKFLSLQYKKISNFYEHPPITNIIHRLYNQGHQKDTILNKVIQEFDIPIEFAKKRINSELNSNESIKPAEQPGIDIKIKYLEPVKEDSDNKYFRIFIEGYQNISQLVSINEFINNFFKLYIILYDTEQSQNELFNKLHKPFINTFIAPDSQISNELSTQAICIDHEKQSDISTNVFHSNEFEGDLDDWGDFESDSENELDDIIDDIQPVLSEGLKTDEHLFTDFDLTMQKKETNPILLRLYEKDSSLFVWEGRGVRKKYSSACQGSRYPMVLTDEEKDRIDIIYPNSYKELITDINCSVDTPKERFIDGNAKCGAVRWGSSDDNQNWYICPKIWDLIDNNPLNISDLEFKGLGIDNKDMTKEKAQKLYGKFYGSTQFTPSSSNWFIDTTKPTTITNNQEEPVYPTIIEFGPLYKGRGVVKNKDSYNAKVSLLFENQHKGKRYNYPGFLKDKNPDGIAVPCCFQNNSKNTKNIFGEPDNEEEYNTNDYIQGWGKNLGWKPPRLGLLPTELFPYFNVDPGKCHTGLLDTSKSCYFRKGIKQSSNSFLSLICSVHPLNTNYTEEQLISDIFANITYDDFKVLNKGNLELIFRNNLSKYISSFQNFLEYILSNQDKDYTFLLEYLTKPHKWLFPTGLILIIIEEGVEGFNLNCPFYMNTTWYEETDNIAFAIKRNNTFEPIFRYNKSLKPIRVFNKNCSNIELFNNLVYKCISESNISSRLEINQLYNKSFNTFFYYN